MCWSRTWYQGSNADKRREPDDLWQLFDRRPAAQGLQRSAVERPQAGTLLERPRPVAAGR